MKKKLKKFIVKVYPSKTKLKKQNQLAWKLAQVVSDKAPLNESAIEMVINRLIDNASVAIASLNRKPVITARQMAMFFLPALFRLENYWILFRT